MSKATVVESKIVNNLESEGAFELNRGWSDAWMEIQQAIDSGDFQRARQLADNIDSMDIWF
tara:strand:- start:270 stop:452 length:183 start_codon:yes stop_codon:yes gene_type:complete